LDSEDIAPELSKVIKSTKTELLFVARMVDMLKLGGRCAVIVPDGVLFGSSNAHVALRKLLVDENQLEAVISLPAGVFRPYAGVSTGILIFTKGGETNEIFFFDVRADGFSLDDKRQPTPGNNDLPALLTAWESRDPKKDTDRSSKSFFVRACEIRENKFDLSLNRYQIKKYTHEVYEPPLMILERVQKLEEEIMADLRELLGMLR
jgi:type I restriction enzyme M protein